MLTCVYHPIEGMRVVEAEEADDLLALGVWFDCPQKARAYRAQVENEIKSEKVKAQPKGKKHEKSSHV